MKFIWKEDKDIGLYILQYCNKDGKFKNFANLYDSSYKYSNSYSYSYNNDIGYIRNEPLKSKNLKDAKKELIGILIKIYSDEVFMLKERMFECDDTISGLRYFIREGGCAK